MRSQPMAMMWTPWHMGATSRTMRPAMATLAATRLSAFSNSLMSGSGTSTPGIRSVM